MNNQDIENGVVLFLTQGRSALLKTLAPLLEQRRDLLAKEPSEFHSEIETQFENLLRNEIAREIAVNLGVQADQVYDIVKTLNVKEFLNVEL